ncbi:MAG: hypothetical protein ACKV22_22620 [Bryobacteraceae bacterium]
MQATTVRWLVVLGIVASSAESGVSQPTVTAVVNAASFDAAVPRGCLISIFGSKLARATASAASLPLPRKLEDASVLVGDLELAAPLYFVSPAQINAQLPFEALGQTLSLVVSTAEGRSKPLLLRPAASGPGLFTRDSSGKGPVLALTPDFRLADAVAPGQPLILYATGLGPTDPPVVSGYPGATQEPLNRVTHVPEVFAGDYALPAPVAFAGLAPGLAGVYQINVTPQFLASDRLFLRSGGKLSNIVQLPVRAGQNVTNATGTIEAVYPTAQDPVGVSPHLLVARFTARMDISDAAGPFAIAAVTDGLASAVITVDPANGTFEGLAPVPTAAARQFDYSGSPDMRFDLFTCHPPGADGLSAFPFPGNIIPASRVSPQELKALELMPLPNTEINRGDTGLLRVQGQARRGATFVIDGSNNSALSVFAAYIPVRTMCARDQVTTLRLIIDGRQVASTEVSYTAGSPTVTGGRP